MESSAPKKETPNDGPNPLEGQSFSAGGQKASQPAKSKIISRLTRNCWICIGMSGTITGIVAVASFLPLELYQALVIIAFVAWSLFYIVGRLIDMLACLETAEERWKADQKQINELTEDKVFHLRERGALLERIALLEKSPAESAVAGLSRSENQEDSATVFPFRKAANNATVRTTSKRR